jgi:PTH1 family peptidyl-tRNA hydrolase
MADYVLNNFTPEEMAGLPRLLDGVVDALELVIAEGAPKAMSLYHNKDLLE